jgi:hypothetical protein
MTRRSVTAGILAIVIAAGTGAAQEAGAPADAGMARIIDLRFAGGSAVAYLDAVRKVAPDVNVVVLDEHVAEVPVMPLELKRVRVATAIEILDGLTRIDGERLVQLDVGFTGPEPAMRIATVRAEVAGPSAPRDQMSHVWTLQEVIGAGTGPQDILTAIETALELAELGTGARLRFHEETKLLIVRGSREQITIVDDVIDRLREAMHARAAAAAARESAGALGQEVGELREQLAGNVREITEWRTRAEILQSTLDELQASLRARDDEIARLSQRLRALETGAAGGKGG